MSAIYEWDIQVLQYDAHGGLYAKTSATIRAADKTEVTEKVRAAFHATYNKYRGLWTHGWEVKHLREVEPSSVLTAAVSSSHGRCLHTTLADHEEDL